MFAAQEGDRQFSFDAGTLVSLNFSKAGLFTKQLLKEAMKHFGSPIHIDLFGKGSRSATIRFASQIESQSFLAKAADLDNSNNWDENVGDLVQASESFKKALVSISHNEITHNNLK